MRSEPRLLAFDEVGRVFAEVADGVEGQLAGDVVGIVVGRGAEDRGPALGGVDELGQGLADVAVTLAVVVEVVLKLVGDGGELLEEVVGVLLTAGLARVREEVADGVGALVEELDVDEDAVAGDVGGVAELLDLAFGEGVVVALGVDRRREAHERRSQQNESEGETTVHSGLVAEDLVEQLVLYQVELFEGGLSGGAIFIRGQVQRLGKPHRGVIEQHLCVLEALGVSGQVGLDELSVPTDLLERGGGAVVVSVGDLLDGHLGHGVDQLYVKVALIAGIGLLGAEFELGECGGVGKGFVEVCRMGGDTESEQTEEW